MDHYHIPLIPLPRPAHIQYAQIDKQILKIWEEYRQWDEARKPKFVHLNVSFRHDPLWDHRLMSIQSAHDGNHIVWKATKVVLQISLMI